MENVTLKIELQRDYGPRDYKKEYRYRTKYSDTFTMVHPPLGAGATNAKNVVKTCAYHFFKNSDGLSKEWPINFEVYVDEERLGNFTVESVLEPTFYFDKKEETK